MRAIIDGALARKRSTIGLLVGLIIAGIASVIAIPKESTPDVQIPIVYVTVSQSGISPEDAERLLVKPMENRFQQIEGIKEMTSSAYQGGGYVQMEFNAGYDIDKALDDAWIARDEVIPELPDDADDPSVHEVNLSLFPIITITLSSQLPERITRSIATNLSDSIKALPNVLEADVSGTLREYVEVLLNPARMESYFISPEQVLAIVARNNRVIRAGDMDTGAGRFTVQVPGLYTNSEDILNLPIRANGEQVVLLRDIADVRPTFREAETFSRVNGKNGISIGVSKRIGTNIIETIEGVKTIVEREAETWPEGVTFAYSGDESTVIRGMLSDLGNTVIVSILLVVVVLIAIIGPRSATMVGIAIPSSLLVAFLILNTIGFTVNIVVLFALILSVGLLVDGSIVMIEFADRKMAEGYVPQAAFRSAAHRMFWPITSSTATTLCAFLPLAFWPGVVGQFMRYLPITQIIVLTTALFMALVILPTIGSLIGKRQAQANQALARAIAAGGNLDEVTGLAGAYLKLLRRVVRCPWLVLTTAAALLVASIFAYSALGKGLEFFPNIEPERMIVRIDARDNLSTQEADRLVREVENQVLSVGGEKHEFYSVHTVSSLGGRENPDTIGQIIIELSDLKVRRPATEIIAELRQRTKHLSGVRVRIQAEEGGPPAGEPLQVRLSSNDVGKLSAAADQVARIMEGMDGVINVRDSRTPPKLGVELQVDRVQAEKLGANLSLVGSYVELFTQGLKVASYRPDHTTDEVDIVARMPVEYRTLSQLEDLRISTNNGFVPLSSFVKINPYPTESTLFRVNRSRTVDVSARMGINPETGKEYLPADKIAELAKILETEKLPLGVRYSFAGEDEEQREASAFLMQAFMVALTLMAVILLTQFNSFFSALLILSAVIMSTAGVLIGLILTGQPFGIVMCGIGVIALAGIIVNNNIVMIDAFNTLRNAGEDVTQAVLRTGVQRMRPVLLTAFTTAFGLLPLVLRLNIDFLGRNIEFNTPSTQWWAQLSTVIVFGLIFATPLTLLVTPAALIYKGRLEEFGKRRAAAREEKLRTEGMELT